MRPSTVLLFAVVSLLGCFIWFPAIADGRPTPIVASPFTDNPLDAENQLAQIEERRRQKTALFRNEPLGFIRRPWGDLNDRLYEEYGFRAGVGIHNMWQVADRSVTGTDRWGAATDFDLNLNWDVLNRGQPDQGGFFVNLEGRWDYGNNRPGPQNLGFVNLATVGGTANTYSKYSPTFIIRQLYWRQGSREAGWSYTIGKITVDGAFASSRHLNPNTTFLPNASGAVFGVAAADSGIGLKVNYAFNKQWSVMGLISDANADRYDFGDPFAGDVFGGIELQWRSPKSAALSTVAKLGVTGTTGTKDGMPANGGTGRSGWGVSALLEQELAPDGRPVIILRYSDSSNDSAIYDQQVAAQFILYQPAGPARFGTDALGLGFNWVDPAADTDARDEYNFEAFYRFPIFPQVDLTADYQYISDPAFTEEFDHAHVFGIRLTTTF
jgi:hypothetical protein